MKYQIVRTNGKFQIRKRFGPFTSYVKDSMGEPVNYASELEAVEFLSRLSKSDSSYYGLVVRELRSEDYHD